MTQGLGETGMPTVGEGEGGSLVRAFDQRTFRSKKVGESQVICVVRQPGLTVCVCSKRPLGVGGVMW